MDPLIIAVLDEIVSYDAVGTQRPREVLIRQTAKIARLLAYLKEQHMAPTEERPMQIPRANL
jgi:hypothetical protein